MTALAFDVYGTLIDTQGVVSLLESYLDEDSAQQFLNRWRDKQLEYSFRRGLMQQYQDFSVCTKDALQFTNNEHNAPLSDEQQESLLEAYKSLPAFDDVKTALNKLNAAGVECFAFSNGSTSAVTELLENAELSNYFKGIVSCEDVKSFKPNPDVYQHFLSKSGSREQNTWLISSNSFDIIGAHAAGWKTAWVKRSKEAQFDPWGVNPTITVGSLTQLIENIK
ncbi:haloacid dehalogenase type II [Idiomarina aminovorans]|uniref:haloacid dehalogenase type II n=1 Tax=Idiomarina aminovorans TaxID=2914829 RepID=UPI002005E946|nr:haloacid dehalogenase type II [Idiomarina sp. ATCH4]MCK7458289.1 haloacid dehalogenase type II [Idiomarina sp. ATCH4]